jgi:hypothetical protein
MNELYLIQLVYIPIIFFKKTLVIYLFFLEILKE